MVARLVLLVAIVSALVSVPTSAHDLPNEVTVNLLVRPEGNRLRVLVRVPMRALGDVSYPVRSPANHVDLARVEPALRQALQLWILPNLRVYERGERLAPPTIAAARISLPSDQSFADFESATTALYGAPLPPDTVLELNQGMLDAELTFALRSDESRLSLEPAFARLGVSVTTLARYLPRQGEPRQLEFTGDPGVLPLEPTVAQASTRFTQLGFAHIFERADHLLLLICLVIPIRRTQSRLVVVLSFLTAVFLTFAASAIGLTPTALWFRPLVTTVMAASVVYVAVENVLLAGFERRWLVAFVAGLAQGYGFAFRFADVQQFAGTHFIASLVSFNIGASLALLLVLLLTHPPLTVLFRHAASEKTARIVSSVLVGHVAWHWMIDRGSVLGRISIAWPNVDAAFARDLTGWLLLAAVSAAAMWTLAVLAAKARTQV